MNCVALTSNKTMFDYVYLISHIDIIAYIIHFG